MRVVNAFIFFDELSLLEIRLHELDSVVDLFVIVETLEHNSNRPKKPICLRPNLSRFKKFEHKIQYAVIDTVYPMYSGREQNSGLAWAREAWQRDQLMPVLQACIAPEDVVLFTEGDEIPRAETIRANREILNTGIHQLEMDFFYYNVNRQVTEPWATAFSGTLRQIQQAGGPAALRRAVSGRGNGEGGQYPWIKNCGWHFSTFGSLEHIRQKFAGFAHAYDPVCKEFEAKRDDTKLIHDIANGEYLTNPRPNWTVWRDIDDRLPAYFLANQEKFAEMTDAYFREKHKEVLKG
jgi:beta-1,4-mannosyl-glycoprotein beta-1,4-N-acetylglucosaminyltransferase